MSDSPTKDTQSIDLLDLLRHELEKRSFHHGDGQFSKIEYCDFCGYSKDWIANHSHGDDCILRKRP